MKLSAISRRLRIPVATTSVLPYRGLATYHSRSFRCDYYNGRIPARHLSTEPLDSSAMSGANLNKEETIADGKWESKNPYYIRIERRISKRIAWIIDDAEELLNRELHTFVYPDDYDRARHAIHSLMHDTENISYCSPAINNAIRLMERCVREYAHLYQSRPDEATTEDLWFCNPSYYNGLLNRWKLQALSNEHVILPRVLSAHEVLHIWQAMSTTLPQLFRYDIASMTIIMQVIIALEPPEEAPMVAERLLEFFRTEAMDEPALLPDVYVQSLVLKAWSESGLAVASQKMEQIVTRIYQNYSRPSGTMDIGNVSMVPYKIWIRYWARLGNIERVESTLQMIELNEYLQSKIDAVILSEALFCYIKVGQIVKAEDTFDRIIAMGMPLTKGEDDDDEVVDDRNLDISIKAQDSFMIAIMASAHYLMNWYRRSVQTMMEQNVQKGGEIPANIRRKLDRIIERTERILEQVEPFSTVDVVSIDRLRNSMMDIYAHAKRLNQMKTVFQKIDQPDRYSFAILIKAYGKMQQPERSVEVVRSMIENPIYTNPDINTINCLLNAWADSSSTHPNCAERALNVYQWIYDDPEVARLNLRPTVVTYSTLLNCLASSSKGVHNVDRIVDMIVKNVEYRNEAGDVSCRPNEIFYTVAIKASLRANDFKQAESILQRMELHLESGSSDEITVRPNIRTYSEFLKFYSKLGTWSAAEKTTQMHDRMRKLSQTMDPSLKPNVYTYNMVLNGWASSNDARAGDQMWKIYEQMMNVDHVELNKYNYTTLLVYYSKSKRLVDVQRAMKLLQVMENSQVSDVHPQSKHYCMVLATCTNSRAVKYGAEVMISFIKACTSGKCRMDDKPNPKTYSWIVTSLLQSDGLVGATQFVLGTFDSTLDRHVLSDFGLVPDLLVQLHQAWTNSDRSDKDLYIGQLDSHCC